MGVLSSKLNGWYQFGAHTSLHLTAWRSVLFFNLSGFWQFPLMD